MSLTELEWNISVCIYSQIDLQWLLDQQKNNQLTAILKNLLII